MKITALKRTGLFLLIIFVLTGITACNKEKEKVDVSVDTTPQSTSVAPTAAPTPAPPKSTPSTPESTNNSVPEGESVGIVYLDPQIDMFLTVYAPGWIYSKNREIGMVLFHSEESDVSPSFAISANTLREKDADEEKLNFIIDQVWASSRSNMETGFSDFQWTQKEKTTVGAYEASRFHFTSKEYDGDYFFWWTEAKLYICSFMTSPEDYEKDYEILESSLSSFQVQSKMQESLDNDYSVIINKDGDMVYSDSVIDVKMVVKGSQWEHDKKDREKNTIYFFPSHTEGYSSFSLSATIPRDNNAAEYHLNAEIKNDWSYIRAYHKESLEDYLWSAKAKVTVGKYQATRYHYEGTVIETRQKIQGDFFYWWTETKLYICTFNTKPEKYDDMYEVMVDTLSSFEMQSKSSQ